MIMKNYSAYLQSNYADTIGLTKTKISDSGCGVACICSLIYKETDRLVDLPTINWLFYLNSVYINEAGRPFKKDSDLIVWSRVPKVFPNLELEKQIFYWENVKNKAQYIREGSIISVESKPNVSHFMLVLEKQNKRIKTVFDSLAIENNAITDFNFWRKFPDDNDNKTVRSIINYKRKW